MKLYGVISRTYQGWAGMHVCVSLILFDFANIYNDILRLLPSAVSTAGVLCPQLGQPNQTHMHKDCGPSWVCKEDKYPEGLASVRES